MGRRGRYKNLLYIRLAFLVVLLIAAFGFHASGSTLVDLHVARIVLVIAMVLVAGWVRRSRGRT